MRAGCPLRRSSCRRPCASGPRRAIWTANPCRAERAGHERTREEKKEREKEEQDRARSQRVQRDAIWPLRQRATRRVQVAAEEEVEALGKRSRSVSTRAKREAARSAREKAGAERARDPEGDDVKRPVAPTCPSSSPLSQLISSLPSLSLLSPLSRISPPVSIAVHSPPSKTVEQAVSHPPWLLPSFVPLPPAPPCVPELRLLVLLDLPAPASSAARRLSLTWPVCLRL